MILPLILPSVTTSNTRMAIAMTTAMVDIPMMVVATTAFPLTTIMINLELLWGWVQLRVNNHNYIEDGVDIYWKISYASPMITIMTKLISIKVTKRHQSAPMAPRQDQSLVIFQQAISHMLIINDPFVVMCLLVDADAVPSMCGGPQKFIWDI